MARLASSTDIMRNREGAKEARIDDFALQQSNLVAQSQHALDQLKEVRAKIADKISAAEQSGKSMTEANSLLAIADQKIADAETAISVVSSYVPPAISAAGTEATASSTVPLDRPRAIGKTAIDAVNQAKKALNDVVVAIAHAMGIKVGQDGRISTTTETENQ